MERPVFCAETFEASVFGKRRCGKTILSVVALWEIGGAARRVVTGDHTVIVSVFKVP